MKLEEYERDVERFEAGGFTGTNEYLAIAAGILARDLETCLWCPTVRGSARSLAARARAVQEKYERADWAETEARFAARG
jgi:hypothetical protein